MEGFIVKGVSHDKFERFLKLIKDINIINVLNEFKKFRKLKVQFAGPDERLSIFQKGELAQQIVDNPLYRIAIKRIEEELINRWKNSPIRDTEGREKIFHRIEALHNIDIAIQGFISTAIYERRLLEEKEKLKSSPSLPIGRQ